MLDLSKMYKTTGKQMPHIGNMVEKLMLKNRITKAEVARQLDVHSIGINRYLKQPTMHAALLWKIGQILEHNFFIDLAEAFPPIESTPEDVLKKQVDELQRENDLYKKMFVKPQV